MQAQPAVELSAIAAGVRESPRATRRRPPLLMALGRAEPPATVEIGGAPYERLDVLKHDSWAATALYSSGGRIVVCKFNRQQAIFGFPMRWLGRRLGAREHALLERLAGVPGIPATLGPVRVDGRVLPHAVAREFIPGHALRFGERVDDDFFTRFRTLLAEVHRRDVAYVDLHKRENVLVGEDGKPYLIDFQISFALPTAGWRRMLPLRWLLRYLQGSDKYHWLKHHLRHRRDQVPVPKGYLDRHRPWWIRLHRQVAVPIRTLRRNLLVALGVRAGEGYVDSELCPEVAFRKPSETCGG